MNKRWTTSNKAVFNVSYHLIWCPKYRRGVLVGDVEERLMQLYVVKLIWTFRYVVFSVIQKYIIFYKHSFLI